MDTTLLTKGAMKTVSKRTIEGNIFLVLIFLITNTFKITIFNMAMVSSDNLQAFLYKLGITFLLETAVYLMLLGIRSRLPFIVYYILQDSYIFINLVYYMYFHSYLHIAQAFALSSEGMGAAGDLSILMSPKLIIILLDLPIVIYLMLVYAKVTVKVRTPRVSKRLILILSCIMFISIIEVWNYSHHYSILNIAKANDSASESLMVQRYGTFANSLADIALNKNSNSLINLLKYGQHTVSKGTNKDKPNFIMIQVESLDANAINKQHDGKYVMPFLHSFSQQSVYYPYTLSYHEAGGTSDCEFSIVNSVEPLGNYPALEINDYDYPNSIVRQLANNSYSTMAFHGDVGSYYKRDIAYPKIGYQSLFDITKMNLEQVGWGAPDSEVFKFAENQLKNVKQPFFAYTITMTSHGPFTNANIYYNNVNYDDIKDQTAKDYMNSLSYVDQSLEDYVNYIHANYKNTYILIWGDHTPDVNNSDYKQASFEDSNRYFEFVPLIISTPDNKVYKETKITASFLDIAPTIANASGIPYNINSDGIDLLNRTAEDKKIPYRGELFDRTDLYNKISKIN